MKRKKEIPEEVREALTEEETAEVTLPEQAPETSAPHPVGERDLEADISQFHTLFPQVKVEQIPQEVWQQVEAGESLTGSYAVYFVKKMREEERIARVNAENEKAAPPRIRHDGADEGYFSPEAVKGMSREEVRRNYQEILRSMDHWN